MARRKLEERNIRKLTGPGDGRGVAVNIPIEIVRTLKWRRGQKVVVKKRGSGILIIDWEK